MESVVQHNNGGHEDCRVTTGSVAETDDTHQFVSLVEWPDGLQLSFVRSTSRKAAAVIAQADLGDTEQYVCTVELEREVLKNAKSTLSIESLSSPGKSFAVFVVGAAGDAELR